MWEEDKEEKQEEEKKERRKFVIKVAAPEEKAGEKRRDSLVEREESFQEEAISLLSVDLTELSRAQGNFLCLFFLVVINLLQFYIK